MGDHAAGTWGKPRDRLIYRGSGGVIHRLFFAMTLWGALSC